MSVYIFKQPNGRYGRFSTIVDCPTHWNFTREQLLNKLLEIEKDQIESVLFGTYDSKIESFERVKRDMAESNMSKENMEEMFKQMEQPYVDDVEELVDSKEDIKRYKKALEFYANKKHVKGGWDISEDTSEVGFTTGDGTVFSVECGDVAKKALNKKDI